MACLLNVELLGPLSCWTASLFIPASPHFFNLQALHWFLCVLSIGQSFELVPRPLQVYCRLRLIDRYSQKVLNSVNE